MIFGVFYSFFFPFQLALWSHFYQEINGIVVPAWGDFGRGVSCFFLFLTGEGAHYPSCLGGWAEDLEASSPLLNLCITIDTIGDRSPLLFLGIVMPPSNITHHEEQDTH